MSIDVNLLGSSGNVGDVGDEGELNVVVHPHPPRDEKETSRLYQQFFTDDGTTAGSNDMRVNGSVTPVEFWIAADTKTVEDGGEDIYIKSVSFLISDTGARLNLFGALPALTTGIDIEHEKASGSDTITNGNRIKTNLGFIRLALGKPSFGTGTDAFLADISGGGR